jgi:hypothetical protein
MALAADISVILIQMPDSSAVKLETRINGNLAPGEGICNFNTRFHGGPESGYFPGFHAWGGGVRESMGGTD